MRVLLIDDHALFRSGLQGLLAQQGIEVVGSVGDGERGIEAAKQLAPDIILLDIRMPGTGGLEILKRLKANDIAAAVIMVTTSDDDRDVAEALRSGAKGYLLKDMEPDELTKALTRVKNGETVVAPELAGALVRVVQRGDEGNPVEVTPLSELTPRELEILTHLAEGQSNKTIAKALGITDGTVKLHVKSVLRKLSVHSRVEAAVIAVEHGLTKRG